MGLDVSLVSDTPENTMRKVLVVDDEPTSCRLICLALEKLDYITIASFNGRHAWETLQANHDIGLLVTDVVMPELDGEQLVHQVREAREFAKLPIIIMSAVVGPKAVSSLLEQGATWFLPKPVDLAEVQHYASLSFPRDND